MIPNTVVRSRSLKYMDSINNTNPFTSHVNEIFDNQKNSYHPTSMTMDSGQVSGSSMTICPNQKYLDSWAADFG